MTPSGDPERIDALARAFYSAFDNRNGRIPAAGAVTSCLHPCAGIAKWTPEGFEVMDPESFAAPRIALLTSGELRDFHEWETSADTTILGDIACRQSTYSKEGTWAGQPYRGGGSKFFQLIRENGHWKIMSVVWQDHSA